MDKQKLFYLHSQLRTPCIKQLFLFKTFFFNYPIFSQHFSLPGSQEQAITLCCVLAGFWIAWLRFVQSFNSYFNGVLCLESGRFAPPYPNPLTGRFLFNQKSCMHTSLKFLSLKVTIPGNNVSSFIPWREQLLSRKAKCHDDCTPLSSPPPQKKKVSLNNL